MLDQNLPGLTREIARACWHAADGVVRSTLDNALYRGLYRAVKGVFLKHVSAFRFCNAARVCEANIPQSVTGVHPRHEQFAGEHVHVYLVEENTPPMKLVRELVQATVKAVVIDQPGRPMHGLAVGLRNAIEKALDHRLFRSFRCGDDPLCHMNEAYDPWDLRDPINLVRAAN